MTYNAKQKQPRAAQCVNIKFCLDHGRAVSRPPAKAILVIVCLKGLRFEKLLGCFGHPSENMKTLCYMLPMLEVCSLNLI